MSISSKKRKNSNRFEQLYQQAGRSTPRCKASSPDQQSPICSSGRGGWKWRVQWATAEVKDPQKVGFKIKHKNWGATATTKKTRKIPFAVRTERSTFFMRSFSPLFGLFFASVCAAKCRQLGDEKMAQHGTLLQTGKNACCYSFVSRVLAQVASKTRLSAWLGVRFAFAPPVAPLDKRSGALLCHPSCWVVQKRLQTTQQAQRFNWINYQMHVYCAWSPLTTMWHIAWAFYFLNNMHIPIHTIYTYQNIYFNQHNRKHLTYVLLTSNQIESVHFLNHTLFN